MTPAPLVSLRALPAGTTRKVLTVGRFLGPEHLPLGGSFHYPDPGMTLLFWRGAGLVR